MNHGIFDQAQIAEIMKGLNAIVGWVKAWAVLLTAIGTVSMALLQTAKNVFPLRSWFQRGRLHRWILATASASAIRDVCTSKAEIDLISLATSGDKEAFYNLPIEDLCTQIRNAVPVILDYPRIHKDLFCCLASEAGEEDIQRLLHPPPPEIFLKRGEHATDEERGLIREYAAAKTRLTAQVRCSIDAIQTSIGFRWKYFLQLASLVLSAILGVIALHLGAGPDHALPTLGATIVIGLLSGFLAPVARDLVAAIENWRN